MKAKEPVRPWRHGPAREHDFQSPAQPRPAAPASPRSNLSPQPALTRNLPTAPPPYRPQAAPKAMQMKTAPVGHPVRAGTRPHPPAPPAYRPQPLPKVLQRKATITGMPRAAQSRGPQAPKVYRPTIPKVLQPKVTPPGAEAKASVGGRTPIAPPVYRPNPAPRVLQQKSAPAKPLTGHSVVQRTVTPGRPQNPARALQTKAPAKTALPRFPARPPSVIQRLVYLDQSRTLYAPATWGAETVALYGQQKVEKTIKEFYDANQTKAKVLGHINNALEINATAITFTDKIDDLNLTYPGNEDAQEAAKTKMKKVLDSHTHIVRLADNNATFAGGELVVVAQRLFSEPNDLGENMTMNKACALIALMEGEVAEGGTWAEKYKHTIDWLKQKDTAKGRTGNKKLYGMPQDVKPADILGKMHKYYFSEAKLMYDDEASHMKLMKEWGYKLVYTGATTFRKLMKSSFLKTGKKYVFDIQGHTLLVKLKKALPAAKDVTGEEKLGDYFLLYHNRTNWDKSDDDTFALPVEDIYEK